MYSGRNMPLVGGKPVSLMTAIVKDYSRPGDLVADPCCGAGSTLQAAEDLGRRYIGIDKDLKHAQMSAGRMGASTITGPLFNMELRKK
jgi:DNA modification methylase